MNKKITDWDYSYERGYAYARWGDAEKLEGFTGPIDGDTIPIPDSDATAIRRAGQVTVNRAYWRGYNAYWEGKNGQ